MRNVLLIEWGGGRNFIQAESNGRQYLRMAFVGYSLEEAIRKYRRDFGLRYKHMDRI